MVVFSLASLRFAADNFYEIASRNLERHNGYTALRYMEAASVLNPSSILVAQAERQMIPGSIPGPRLLIFHPNDYDALIIRTDELRVRGKFQEARRYLYKAAKADPYYATANNGEMSGLLK